MYIFAGIGSLLIALLVGIGFAAPIYIFRKKIIGGIKGWFSKKPVASGTRQGK